MGALEGIKVIELAQWIAGPAAAALLAEWGADVIKVEPLQGEPLRGMLVSVFPTRQGDANFLVDQVNRGKRSIAVNLRCEEGKAILHQLVAEADVLVTNLRPKALRELGATYEEVRPYNPRLVYCQITGYGHGHGESDRALVDVGVYARLGLARLVTPASDPEGKPPQEPNGIFDHTTSMVAAGAVALALYDRERTGAGRWVGVSLVRVGAFMLSWDLLRAIRLGSRVRPVDRRHVRNPLINCYRAGDGRWLWLLCAQPDRHWRSLCEALDREDLLDDPRFSDTVSRARNAADLVDELDREFGRRPLSQWAEILDRHDIWWAPVNNPNEAVADPLLEAAGALADIDAGARHARVIAGPVEAEGIRPRGPVPEVGQHTEEVLLELGYDWDAISDLKRRGVIL